MTHFLFVDAHMFFEEHGPSAQSAFPSSLSVDPEPHFQFTSAARSKG